MEKFRQHFKIAILPCPAYQWFIFLVGLRFTILPYSTVTKVIILYALAIISISYKFVIYNSAKSFEVIDASRQASSLAQATPTDLFYCTFIAVLRRAAIKRKREFVLLQFYYTCADAYNKRAYNKTKVCLIFYPR